MAGPQTYHKLAPVDKDELAKNISTKGSSTPTLTPVVFCAPILAPPQVFALAQGSTSTLGLSGRYTDEDLQKVTKLALEFFIKS